MALQYRKPFIPAKKLAKDPGNRQYANTFKLPFETGPESLIVMEVPGFDLSGARFPDPVREKR